jgi:hypothetical protein
MSQKKQPPAPEPAPVVNAPVVNETLEWQRDMQRAVPSRLVSDLVNDFRRGPAGPSSIAGARSVNEPPRAPSGGTVEVRPPDGLRWIDQMCDHADRQAQVAAIRQRIENEWVEGILDRSKPNRAKSEYSPAARYDDEVPPLHRDKD